jgi:hypothetical protein
MEKLGFWLKISPKDAIWFSFLSVQSISIAGKKLIVVLNDGTKVFVEDEYKDAAIFALNKVSIGPWFAEKPE